MMVWHRAAASLLSLVLVTFVGASARSMETQGSPQASIIPIGFSCNFNHGQLTCGETKKKKKDQPKLEPARSMACPGALEGTTVCQTCPSGSVTIAMTCNFCPPGMAFAGDSFHCVATK